MRARRSAVVALGVTATFASTASALDASACAERGFIASECARSSCESLLRATSSRAAHDDCVACCAADVGRARTKASLRVCE
ncbi:hypothetical protein BE221DRAFT_80911 [Ostreococcus tauri]|uniref:Uncharacterized protein n=1 Tax=Ostreococcus tauri TaxID=70448 RepID=A0A1Y5I8M3_OSTTA|nr:hypothetical protein BE221DRAFT_80911 [Ostreococcus tauri]